MASVLAFCVFSVTGISSSSPVLAATVKEEAVKESRILVDSKEMFIDQKTIFNVMLKDRTSNEDLVIVPEKKGVVQVKTGKWGDEEKTFTLVPKKEGTVTLKISLVATKAGKQKTLEEVELTVHVSERKELTPKEVYDNCSQAMIEILAFDSVNSMSVGSGFFISENQILTNYHVIEKASRLIIRDYSGKVYEVTHIVDYTSTYDLAILQVKETSEHALVLNSKTVETGETVYALGSPLELTGTLSDGIVSTAYRSYENMIYHQSTAYISKNSGGGPLLNRFGEVIGVNTLMLLGEQNVYLAVDIRYINQLNRKEPKPIQVLYDENVGKVKEEIIYISIP
jgi:S1-C subfamily serine protease